MRWWSDPEVSRALLALVDDSDPAQGTATAVLGHHGLCMAVLEPLSKSTLVDGLLIIESLRTVDLEPVVKALDVSVGYGKSKADLFHARAMTDTVMLTKALNSTLPMPLAVARAAQVHGVPLYRLGPYVAAMRAPQVPQIVVDDLADRALMLWAHDVYAG